MSVEPDEFMSEVWTRWQGHLINGVFPLGRYLGCSDHSGVFLTKSPSRGAQLAIKLVPTNRTLAEIQLPRWKRAGSLEHPHLLRLLEWGGCQLDGLPYLYTVMEYADQTLAQLLLSRALSVEEAREMLAPTLDALAFLHARNLVHGQLKPANILVVGDQLRLASDTVRRVGEGRISNHALGVYDAPETRDAGASTAGDIWALGVSLSEALTRHPPAVAAEPAHAVVLPTDFCEAFREVVARCLSVNPQTRPTVTELIACTGNRSPPCAPAPSRSASGPPPVSPEPAQPARSPPSPKRAAWPTVVLAAVVSLALVWVGARHWRSRPTPAAAASPVQSSGGAAAQDEPARAERAAQGRGPEAAPSAPRPSRGDAALVPGALHQVIPEVSPTARHTIRGHIKVWVRVVVDRDGAVLGAVADRTGPSRYFEQVAIDAAKKWTFPPADGPTQRLMQIRFDFSHAGTTAQLIALK